MILGFTAAIFVLVEELLIAFVIKYRSRTNKRADEGAQVHGNTRLELIWTVIPALILAVIAIVVFVELPGISNAPAAANPLRVTVEGHQYYWQFDYPNKDAHDQRPVRAGRRVVRPDGRVVGRHPQLVDPVTRRQAQAIPGITNHTWFKADEAGTYIGQCAEASAGSTTLPWRRA